MELPVKVLPQSSLLSGAPLTSSTSKVAASVIVRALPDLLSLTSHSVNEVGRAIAAIQHRSQKAKASAPSTKDEGNATIVQLIEEIEGLPLDIHRRGDVAGSGEGAGAGAGATDTVQRSTQQTEDTVKSRLGMMAHQLRAHLVSVDALFERFR